jgi:hypothetical protein
VGGDFTPSANTKNHSSADKYPADIQKYIDKEVTAGALRSTDFKSFQFRHVSPLMSRPKEGSSRRVILDLSWPKGQGLSVNSCVLTDSYLDSKFILKLPTVDTITKIINSFNTKVLLFKIDLARAFRQIPLDPLDAAYLGIHWAGKDYIDCFLPFGWRHGSAACQRITDIVRFILKKQNVTVVNYIDDLIGIAPVNDAYRAFELTKETLSQIGLKISEEKTVPPSEECICLGITINTVTHTLSIPPTKLKAIINMCTQYQKQEKLTKKKIQSILGSLIYVHKAVAPARLFVNRIISTLKMAPEEGFMHVGVDFKRDLLWFRAFAELYNGKTKYNNLSKNIKYNVYVDASLKGLGGNVNNLVYSLPIEGGGDNIAHWEAVNVLFALRTWAHLFKGTAVRVFCDNSAAVSIFNTARGADPVLQAIARNIWLLAAAYDMKLDFQHIPGEHNQVADLLSRWTVTHNPVARLYSFLNGQPHWCVANRAFLLLNWEI